MPVGALYHVLGARAQFSGREEENMKKQNGERAAFATFLLCVLQAGFGCAAVFNTSKEAYPWPSIVLHCHRLASFAEVL